MLESTTVITVGELSRLARQTLERAFPLLWVAGEVSNLTRAVSGHLYFTLKDETAQVRCVMFRLRAQSIPWRLENGQQVEARVLVSLYEPRGDFQLNIETLRRAGLGRLFEAFARLKGKLELEGLFAPEKKRLLPRFPRRIGIVCSPRAAALHDVLTALRRRAPHLDVILYPTLVQGDTAASEIAAAISLANQRAECDLLLVVRGGGSLEDLWAFNEEAVARAIAGSVLPVISGIGHETDTTIADLVADVRAATPTAAAELASQAWYESRQRLADLLASLHATMQRRVERDRQRIDHLSRRLIHPAIRLRQGHDRLPQFGARLDAAAQRSLRRCQKQVDDSALRLSRAAPSTTVRQGNLRLLSQRLNIAIHHSLEQHHHRLEQFSRALSHLDPQQVLARGFAIVRDSEDKIIRTAACLSPGDAIAIQFAIGTARSVVIEASPEGDMPLETVVSRDNPD